MVLGSNSMSIIGNCGCVWIAVVLGSNSMSIIGNCGCVVDSGGAR